MSLTPKQKRFAKEYLIDLNATQAAKRAGYSKKTAYSIGFENLKKPEIQKEIQKQMKKREERTEITQDRVLNELALISFSDIQNYIEIDEGGGIRAKEFEEMPGESSRALRSVREDRVIKEDAKGDKVTVYDKVKFELYDKPRCLEQLGKHLGMFVNEHRISGSLNVKVITAVPRPKKGKK